MKIRIGTRGSKLALWQAHYIKALLEKADAGISVELVIIKTSGDAIQDVSLTDIGGKGLFVKEIEKALLSKEVDIAVHSMKDMPAEIPEGLFIAATPPAEEPWDAILFNKKTTLSALRSDAVIGTTSLRRIVQLKKLQSGLKFAMLRGNIDTRVRKLLSGQFDAIVIAYAGMNRLGIKPEFMEKLSIIPAAGQGIIAIEARRDTVALRPFLDILNDSRTFYRASAERGFVTRLGASCQIPAGAHADVIGDTIEIEGFIADMQGNDFYRSKVTGSTEQAYETGVRLAEELLESGASRFSGQQS